MANTNEFPAQGKVTKVNDDSIIFCPHGTNYELTLKTAGKYEGPVNERVDGLIRASGRKLWTVPSGGNFIVPIKGPPRIVQGRIRYIDEQIMIVQAGTKVVVELPADGTAYDMVNGGLQVGSLVNATILPGAAFELAGATAVK